MLKFSFCLLYLLVCLAPASASAQDIRTLYKNALSDEKARTETPTTQNLDLPADKGFGDVFSEVRNYEKQGEYKKALNFYQAYLKNKAIRVNRREARFKQRLIKRALAKSYTDELAWYLKVDHARALAEYEIAIQVAEQYLQQFPQGKLLDNILVLAAYISLVDIGSADKALDYYQKLFSQRKKSVYINEAMYGEALAYEELGQYTESRESLKRLLSKHTALSIRLVGAKIPRDSLLSRLWFNRANNRLAILESRIQAEDARPRDHDFIFAMGGRFRYDQPVGTQDNYRFIWHLLEKHQIPATHITHWITRQTNWRWESSLALQAASRKGYTPVISYWYFGDEISPQFVRDNKEKWYQQIQEKLIPLIKNTPDVMIVLEPEFNKRGVEKWPEWDGIVTRAIELIKEGAPQAKVGLAIGDWEKYESGSPINNVARAIDASDFVAYLLMTSGTYENANTDLTQTIPERSRRFVHFLKNTFDKPIYLAYIAISTENHWQQKQAVYLEGLLRDIPFYQQNNVIGLGFFSLFDSPNQTGWFETAEPYFGLLGADGEDKLSAQVWRDGVNAYRAENVEAPRLLKKLDIVNKAEGFTVLGELSKWAKWSLRVEGQNTGAVYTYQGAGQKIHINWSGLALEGRFESEPCQIYLQGEDQHGNTFQADVTNTFLENPLKIEEEIALRLIPGRTLLSWGRNSRITRSRGGINAQLNGENSGFNVLLPRRLGRRINPRNGTALVLEANIRLLSQVENTFVLLEDDSGQKLSVLLEYFLDGTKRDFQSLKIPLQKNNHKNPAFDISALSKLSLFSRSSKSVEFDLQNLKLVVWQ